MLARACCFVASENSMGEALKIIIPMAGFGTRMRPHTWSKPKPLVSVAGQAILGHVIDSFQSAPNAEEAEFVFILGYLGEQVKKYMAGQHPDLKAHYVEQEELLGQSHALAQAREYLKGPTLIVFVDTLIDADYSFLANEEADAVIWVKSVEDPRRFGVVDVGEDGFVKGLIEKPDSMENNLAVVGVYYFKKGEDLLAAIDEQIANHVQTKNEFFLADAIDMLLKKGMRLRPVNVDLWLDAGLPETVLESNRVLLTNGLDNGDAANLGEGNSIKGSVFIHPDAQIENSLIGPAVTISAGCVIKNSEISDSILEKDVRVENTKLKASIIGERCQVIDFVGQLNIGDDSKISGT